MRDVTLCDCDLDCCKVLTPTRLLFQTAMHGQHVLLPTPHVDTFSPQNCAAASMEQCGKVMNACRALLYSGYKMRISTQGLN
jgi:hypothetical protein